MSSTSSSAQTASAPDSFFTATLDQADPDIAAAIRGELGRQRHEIELIASENIVSRAVLEAQGSVMTNKYAEGYPGNRYYGGCEWVDVAETLAIERAKKLFGAQFANVQPNSGSQMNQAVFLALLQPGDTFMGLDLAAGGHLTHGSPVNMSGKWFKASHYTVRREDQVIDMDAVAKQAEQVKPKLIIGGGSAYSRPYFTAYAASKSAVVRFGECLADEVREHNVQVNTIAPGGAYTTMTDEILRAGEDRAGRKEIEDAEKVRITGGVAPEKQTQLAIFLASQKSNHISGKLIHVNDDWKRMRDSNMHPEAYTLRRVLKV